jgi:hypothetical protein
MKQKIKAVLPKSVISVLKGIKVVKELMPVYIGDLKKYYLYSDIKGSDTAIKLISKIIREYHVVEKGLTMPDTRLGFGKLVLISLCNNCMLFIKQYGKDDEQLRHAVGVIYEYIEFHESHKFALDKTVIDAVEKLKNRFESKIDILPQRNVTDDEYWQNSNTNFEAFSNSRSSVRNFSQQEVPIESIIKSIELARNTPSACNRQSWRTYVFTNKEKFSKILEVQGGNRGFGNLANKVIVITGEIGVFLGNNERNQVYVDGGLYAMNLLYTLHYHKIATCILNCSVTVDQDKKLRAICNIKPSEVFIAMIICGNLPELFKIAVSKRYKIDKTNTIVE